MCKRENERGVERKRKRKAKTAVSFVVFGWRLKAKFCACKVQTIKRKWKTPKIRYRNKMECLLNVRNLLWTLDDYTKYSHFLYQTRFIFKFVCLTFCLFFLHPLDAMPNWLVSKRFLFSFVFSVVAVVFPDCVHIRLKRFSSKSLNEEITYKICIKRIGKYHLGKWNLYHWLKLDASILIKRIGSN